MTGTLATGAAGALGTLTRIGGASYAYVQGDGGWCLSNAGIVVGDHSVVFDMAATERRARAWLAEVQRLVGERGWTLVNSHFHGDHTLGNYLVPDEVPILAHPRAREDMASTGLDLTRLWPEVEWGDVELRLPSDLVSDSVTLACGSHPVEISHLGVAHTTGDLIAWVPDDGVLFAGDQVMSDCTPFYLFGSVLGAADALGEMKKLDPAVVVPGHGPLGGPELIEHNLRYLDWVLETASGGLKRGASAFETALAAGPGPFPTWIDDERHVANIHRAYADLEGRSPGEPLDAKAVFEDVIRCCASGYPVCRA